MLRSVTYSSRMTHAWYIFLLMLRIAHTSLRHLSPLLRIIDNVHPRFTLLLRCPTLQTAPCRRLAKCRQLISRSPAICQTKIRHKFPHSTIMMRRVTISNAPYMQQRITRRSDIYTSFSYASLDISLLHVRRTFYSDLSAINSSSKEVVQVTEEQFIEFLDENHSTPVPGEKLPF